MTVKCGNAIRGSQNQIRSNPILHSQRAFQLGTNRREQEERQLACLVELQQAHVPLFNLPEFIRADASCLQLSDERVGIVGLVVDNNGEGYVTRLRVRPSSERLISIDLPFRSAHVQSLLLRILGEPGVDQGLPELLAFEISDTLAARCEGDSMDVACLLAVIDSTTGQKEPLFAAAAAVVSPINGELLEPSKSTERKLKAFQREFKHGTLLVRHPHDREAAGYDGMFDEVWQVRSLGELSSLLRQHKLTESLLNDVPLRAEHGPAIATRIQYLMQDESRFGEAQDFIRRLRERVGSGTPMRISLGSV